MQRHSRAVQSSFWDDLRYVVSCQLHPILQQLKSSLHCIQKWPKYKSRLRVWLSYKLWKGHLKEVEGHFGTFVVSYFVFLRWLFIMNIVIFALWFGFVCVPQIIQQFLGVTGSNRTSQVACVISVNGTNGNCSSDSLQRTNGIRMAFEVPVACLNSPQIADDNSFGVRTCAFSNEIAVRESSSSVTVAPAPIIDTCAQGSNMSNAFLVCVGVQPDVPWFQYILNFFSGQGIFNETLLFQGFYPNAILGGYNIPLAFLTLAIVVYVISIVLLVYK